MEDAPPTTRRSLRQCGGSSAPESAQTTDDTAERDDTTTTPARGAPEAAEPTDAPTAGPTTAALAWVDAATLARTAAPVDLSSATTSYTSVGADLLAKRPRRSLWRPGVVWPTAAAALVVGAYAATTLLWPLHAVAPTVTPIEVAPIASAPLEMSWPEPGSSAVSVAGISSTLASSDAVVPMASITKVVTALLVLDRMPPTAPSTGNTAIATSRRWMCRSAAR